MGARKKSRLDSKGSRQRSIHSPGREVDLKGLHRRFDAFRQSHPAGTRVPEGLRMMALTALREGAVRADVLRVCGVSLQQLDAWKRRNDKSDSKATEGRKDARVFSVVGEHASVLESDIKDLLELRVRGWSMTLRRVEEGSD